MLIYFFNNILFIRIIYTFLFLFYSLYFNDLILCEDYPIEDKDCNNVCEQSFTDKDLEDKMVDFNIYCNEAYVQL